MKTSRIAAKLLSSATLGLLVLPGAAEAASIKYPPATNSQGTLGSVLITTPEIRAGGVQYFVRDFNDPTPGGQSYAGLCDATVPLGECSYFDFFESLGNTSATSDSGVTAGPGFGLVEVVNTPQPDAFDEFLGLTGLITDAVFPYIGEEVVAPNLDLPLAIREFIILDPSEAPVATAAGRADSFDVTTLAGVIIEDNFTDNTSSATVSAEGFWNVENPDSGLVERFAGTVIFSTTFVNPTGVVDDNARSEEGQRTGLTATINIVENRRVPEPSVLLGLGLVASCAALSRNRKDKKR